MDTTRKTLLLAKKIGEMSKCGSRKIGVIIEHREAIISIGYNGPVVPMDKEYLSEFFWSQLTDDEVLTLLGKYATKEQFLETCTGCPRKLLGAGAGERSTLCACQHAEREAISRAQKSLEGSTMFAYCGIPCIDCAGAIVNAGISTLHCLDVKDYHPESRFLLKDIDVIQHAPIPD